MTTQAEPVVLVERANGVVTLLLNRPSRKNGLTAALVDALIDELHRIAVDPEDRVVIVAGNGDSFCSGMDLAEPPRPDELTFMRRVGQLCNDLFGLSKPTIAKVRGAAFGFGANFALCCDLVLASADATFGEVFVERGLSVDGGGSWSLPRRVGLAKAKELLLLGQRVSGTEAAEMGLINRAVADTELDALCDDWAGKLAAGPPRAQSTIKALLNSSFHSSFAGAVEAEAVAQSLSFRSEEAAEGIRAFAERRAPDFRRAASGK